MADIYTELDKLKGLLTLMGSEKLIAVQDSTGFLFSPPYPDMSVWLRINTSRQIIYCECVTHDLSGIRAKCFKAKSAAQAVYKIDRVIKNAKKHSRRVNNLSFAHGI